ncbi:MAG: hypothetical protein ACRCXK_13335 [Wohlfahrtiimonas sp.]
MDKHNHEFTEIIHEQNLYPIMGFISMYKLDVEGKYSDKSMTMSTYESSPHGNNLISITETTGSDLLEISFNLNDRLAEKAKEVIRFIRKEEENDEMWDEIDEMEIGE